jgi:ABC-type phosphate transport system auxiliary subunit
MDMSVVLLGVIALVSAISLFLLWQIYKNLALQSKRQGSAYEELNQALISLTQAVEVGNRTRSEQRQELQRVQEIFKSGSSMQVEQLRVLDHNLAALKESLEESIKI